MHDPTYVDPAYHFWTTPDAVVAAVVARFAAAHPAFAPARVLDAGAGPGAWGNAVRAAYPDAALTGVELRDVPAPAWYDVYHAGTDFLTWAAPHRYDLIVANPPFGSLMFPFVQRCITQHMAPNGFAVFYLPQRFTASRRRYVFFRQYPFTDLWTITPRPSHSGNGRTEKDGDYNVVVWRHGYEGPGYAGDWLYWRDDDPAQPGQAALLEVAAWH